jgi:hypothetical protein
MQGGDEEGDGQASGPARGQGDAAKGRRTRLLPMLALVVGAVVAGVILVGAIAGYLEPSGAGHTQLATFAADASASSRSVDNVDVLARVGRI